jgi:uncharacterized protein YaiI (UPF0178 family)
MNCIFIDADACPVKDETLSVADRHGLRVYVVSNGGIRPNPHPLVETIVVADGPDVADQWIAERAGIGDVVITGDVPLAAKCIAAQARVLRHNGEVFNPDNIGNQLATRNLFTDLRAADPFRLGRGQPFSQADRSHFLNALEREVKFALKASI